MTTTVLFDGSFEGFLTIVHNHYYEKIHPDFIELEDQYQQRFDTRYYNLHPDAKKAETVLSAVINKISKEAARTLYFAFLSIDPENFINMYKFTVNGFKYGSAIEKYLHLDGVLNTINIAKKVSRESGKITELLRFSETSTGVFYADISPQNNVLAPITDFFVARFANMPFMIHDVRRGLAAVYDTKTCIFREAPDDINIILSDKEPDYQKLWRGYYKAIANPERINKKLQRQLVPLKYRKHMTEFVPGKTKKQLTIE